MIIDIFNHFMPAPYFDRLKKLAPELPAATAFPRLRTLWDLDARLRLLDQFGDYQQVLSLANPPLELLAPPEQTPDYARMANDGLADLCRRHPQRFPTFIASLPMNNIDASLAGDRPRGERSRRERHPGVHQCRRQAAERAGIPADVRPHGRSTICRSGCIRCAARNFPTTRARKPSENEIWFTFGWPYETTACMTRLIYSGLFDELPKLKIITHHMGGMIPYFAGKIALGFRQIFFGAPDRNPGAENA